MQILRIAFRNLNRQKKRAVLLGGAIGFGVLIITLVHGFTAGASANLKENFAYLLAGHVYVAEETRRDDDTVVREFRHPEILQEVLEELDLAGDDTVRRSELYGSLFFSGRRTEQAISGVDWTQEPGLRSRLVLLEGDIESVIQDPQAIVLNEQAARKLGVEVGEQIILRTSTVTGQQNVGDLTVRGIAQDPGILGSLSSYAHLQTVNELLNISRDSFQSVHITLPRLEDTSRVTSLLYEALDERTNVAERSEPAEADFSAMMSLIYQDEEQEPWTGSRFVITNIQDYTNQIDQLAGTLNLVGTGILLVLVIIIMVGVINTFRMIMYERVREIGTMRALGMQRRGIRRIFLWEAFSLATMGYLAGIVGAVVIGALLGLIPIPLDSAFALFTENGRLSFPLQAGALAGNYVLITVLTVLAAAIPARKAARMKPVDALRSVA
ncbi:MAG: ABC transporter permease [Spirochaeta sp.]